MARCVSKNRLPKAWHRVNLAMCVGRSRSHHGPGRWFWYTGQFYALYYAAEFFKVDLVNLEPDRRAALLIGTPLFIYLGTFG